MSNSQSVKAVAKYIRMSSHKVRRVLDQTVGGGRIESFSITKSEEKVALEKMSSIPKVPVPIKRVRDETPMPQVKRPVKDFTTRCHRRGCVGEVIAPSNYCGDSCAMLAAGELTSALLEYRSRLDHDLSTCNDTNMGEPKCIARKGDIQAYRAPIVSQVEALSAVVAGLTRKGFVFSSADRLPSFLTDGEYLNIDALDGEKYDVVVTNAEKKKTSGSSSPLSIIPAASFYSAPAAATKETNSSSLTAADLLHSIRTNLEEIFVNSFLRLMDAYPYVSAVLLAIEVEEALRIMYTEENNGKKNLNRKECRSHYLKLARNLKFAHNDYLVCENARV